MKIFIAGARAITQFDGQIESKLFSIYEKGYDVLVGDAAGADCSVQKYYAEKKYSKVTVFACNGKARNNIGNWNIENVKTDGNLQGFEYYKQKDFVMAHAADYGFMIWNGESKGTLNNIINLLAQEKTCCVYLESKKRFFTVDSEDKILKLLSLCPKSTGSVYHKLTKTKANHFTQIALF